MNKLISFILLIFLSNSAFGLAKVKNDLTLLKNSFNNIKSIKASASEICLAKNLYYEARGNLDEQLLVGIVTLNRAHSNSDSFANTICGVIAQKNQFSWYKKSKRQKIHDMAAWHTALRASKALMKHKDQIRSKFIYFHNKRIHPKWSKTMHTAYRSKGHVYY